MCYSYLLALQWLAAPAARQAQVLSQRQARYRCHEACAYQPWGCFVAFTIAG
ncbi:hypothetical protein [Hymenobacter arizonensis]|uniref:hypothetical protein n=1 Tax=Hymenobacter arizonensis TaxID=1227077 RepID=UPI001F203CF9|nr:hypothetical protein [Hymenobacter arizonensis]